MAETKPSPAPRPIQGVRRSATPSGVTHVRTYQSGQYVVVGNHLAQHRELSLTAIGLATHIFSLPESTPVDIRSLAERFPEGRERIASALRELEAHGYLERVREHTESGRLVTRTYAHHTPQAARAALSTLPRPVRAVGRGGTGRTSAGVGGEPREAPKDDDQAPAEPEVVEDPEVPAPVPVECATARPPREPARREPRFEEAVTLLAGLRRTDARLILSLRDVNRLAPSVIDWFDRGATPAAVHRTLTADLPAVMKHPAGVIAYRLRELLPPPLPALPAPPPPTAGSSGPYPFQDCDGCDRVFRAPAPGRCRDCRSGPTAAGEVACAA
ncbi:helix-turn-helix domain-containing protein [Streptomyces marokkonensis]|uniref:Helix-turn-helix domain-containing protein n=1 Tax=Streptomyces marokkonensis TaxID=324855 RepID=A0ABW6Q834_9ACTN